MASSLQYSSAKSIPDVDIRLETIQATRALKTPETPGDDSPGKKKRKKKKDGFAGTFGKIKAIDPLAEENKKHMANMEKGFLELLDLHNTMELSSLCGMMGIRIERKTKNVEKKQYIMALINKQIKELGKPDVVYVGVLKHMWEGTLFEYLRSKGQPLHSTENDPRGFVIAYWRKMTKTIVPFDPYYVPTNLVNRAKDDRRADDINAILDTMEQKELSVKAMEFKIRREHDYTNVLGYLQAVSSLHNTEQQGRNYLINEVEISRAKVAHSEESIQMLNVQLTELENRHEFVKTNWLDNLAHTETMGSDYFDQIVVDQGDKQHHNNLIRRQLLDVRAGAADEDFPGEEEDNVEEPAKDARMKADATIRGNSFEEVSAIHDTEQLLRRLGIRNRRERHALKQELKEERIDNADLRKKLEEALDRGDNEQERADAADDKLFRLNAQNDQFKDRVAAREAVIETEANEYFDLAATATYSASDLAKRINDVLPVLQGMMMSDSNETVKDAAKIVEGLGLMSHDVLLEHMENNAMMKEEAACREAEIMIHVKRAKTPKGKAKAGAETTTKKKAAGTKKPAAKKKK
jgi:hypothetical protein